ncbi:MAG: filamentous hemagglutinin N-terminal domain-containing protein, partial [Leptolyngbyaceae bacterium]|nr:filamentous hemagglutinin N-terminal domain-containing protein [Leptolyngbyaceae bacterium]
MQPLPCLKPAVKSLSALALCHLVVASPLHAQIIGDTTLSNHSIVTTNGNLLTITGGGTAGTNLFHSFEQFSVQTGKTAFFNHAPDIQNIIARVTGGVASSIDGVIRANAAANLFLLNPSGIILGPNAVLNIGGSFLASTASSIKFEDNTEFSATDPKPLLTVSAPVGLVLGPTPGDIRVQSTSMLSGGVAVTENGDAGQLLNTAQDLTNTPE